MNCLEKYRSKLIKETNHNLRILLDKSDKDEETEVNSAHDFRVGVKRLTALYFFLHQIKPAINAKNLLKPYRSIFKSIGKIRDAHVAVHLLQELQGSHPEDSQILIKALKSGITKDFDLFQKEAQANHQRSIRVPTIRSTGISERAILRSKQNILDNLLSQITGYEERISNTSWHKKRILLKRYHHIIDAFQFCPGHQSDEVELKQIKMLEQLLGDWHDRITTIEILQTLQGHEDQAGHIITTLNTQDKLLLGSAKIYLNKYSKWHENQ